LGEARAVTKPADSIEGAFASQRLIPLPSERDPTLNAESAYAIASEIHARRVRRGEQPVGRKIGFSNRAIWETYGVDAPIWGHVYASTLHHAPDGVARFALGPLLQPRLEPEIQLHFARTPPVTKDEAAILACIDWIAHGFEIVQCPYRDWRFTAADSIAACALHGALVVGRPVAVSGIEDCAQRLRSFTITLSKDGVARARGRGSNVLDSPLLAFGQLAEALAGQTQASPVHAGEIVTTGTLTAPFPVAAGETWSTTLDGIALPGLAVTFV
jgi:2-oxo-3-hexenedioate decarboxylase